MQELRDIVQKSNEALEKIQDSLGSRLAILEQEFLNAGTRFGPSSSGRKMTRATQQGQEQQLKKLEQLAKLYGIFFSNGKARDWTKIAQKMAK